MTPILQRITTGAVLVVLITVGIIWNMYSYFLLMAVINFLTVYEFYGLMKNYTQFPRKWAGILFSGCLFIGIILTVTYTTNASILLALIPLASVFFIIEIFQRSPHPIENIGILFLGNIWITLSLLFFTLTAMVAPVDDEYDPAIPLGCFVLIWIFDSFAFLTGKWLGKTHVFSWVSPKKTLEGCIGGAAICIIAAQFIPYFTRSLRLTDWIIMALIITITGTLGDLSKSLLKRAMGIKDSGRLLPGHGGMLDRFDSLIGSAPFLYGYLILFKQA